MDGAVLTVPRELWQNISRLSTVLDDTSIGPFSPISEDALYREFREALAKTDSRPNWSAYARNLLFTRDFESGLKAETLKRLGTRDLSDSPLILHGPTSTGKTVALARLAYTVRAAAEFPVIFVERKTQKPGFAEIEQFCRWLESKGVRSTLLVWDGMLDPDEYIRAARYLTSKGRKVVVVGSCYRLQVRQGCPRLHRSTRAVNPEGIRVVRVLSSDLSPRTSNNTSERPHPYWRELFSRLCIGCCRPREVRFDLELPKKSAWRKI